MDTLVKAHKSKNGRKTLVQQAAAMLAHEHIKQKGDEYGTQTENSDGYGSDQHYRRTSRNA